MPFHYLAIEKIPESTDEREIFKLFETQKGFLGGFKYNNFQYNKLAIW